LGELLGEFLGGVRHTLRREFLVKKLFYKPGLFPYFLWGKRSTHIGGGGPTTIYLFGETKQIRRSYQTECE